MEQKYCTNCGTSLREGTKFCSNCGTKVTNAKEVQQSPERIETSSPLQPTNLPKKPMSKQAKLLYGGLALVVLGAFMFTFVSHISDNAHPVIEKQQTIAMYTMYADQTYNQHPVPARVENGKIIIPLTILLEKKMVEFEYKSSTTVVPLLAYISNEGKLVTSIRFCEPCNSKTFQIEGKELLCGNCTTRWNLNNLRGITGSCQKYPPAPIPSEVVGNEIHIDEKIVADWKLRI